jgi:hypothetical protein
MNARAKGRGVEVMFLMLSLAALSCRESNTKESEDPRPGPESTNPSPTRERGDDNPPLEGGELSVSGTLRSKEFLPSMIYAKSEESFGQREISIGFFVPGGRRELTECLSDLPDGLVDVNVPSKDSVSITFPVSVKKGQTIAYGRSPESMKASYVTLNHPGSEGRPVMSGFREGKITILDISEESVSGRFEVSNSGEASRVSGTFKVPIQPCPKK